MKDLDSQRVECVRRALVEVGVHPHVPATVAKVAVAHGSPPLVAIDVVLHYRSATPVCCDEPGCYVPFLGWKADHVPAAVAAALALAERPDIEITVRTEHESGYKYSALKKPEPEDSTMVYEPEEFRPRGTR